MLKNLLGAALLTGGSAALGLCCSRELKRRLARRRGLLERLQRLQMEVCRLQTPLTEVLTILCGREPRGCIESEPFALIWKRSLRDMKLDGDECGLLETLGEALCRGDEPERAFAAAHERLRALCMAAEAEAESKCRLYSSLGLCGGLLVSLVLL